MRKRAAIRRVILVSSGLLLSSGCDVAGAVIQTVLLAFDIVDVWV